MMNLQQVRAAFARGAPIENMVSSYFRERVFEGNIPTIELQRRLSVADFLCRRTLEILVDEMDVRGPTETLIAISEVETLQKEIQKLKQ